MEKLRYTYKDSAKLNTEEGLKGLPGSSVENAICGIRIVKNGKPAVNDDYITCSGGSKTIIGTKSNGDVVLIVTNGRLLTGEFRKDEFSTFTSSQHARLAAALGCKDAIILDGGGSTALCAYGEWSFTKNKETKSGYGYHNYGRTGKQFTRRHVLNAMLFDIKE